MKTYVTAALFILFSSFASAAPQSVGTVILSFGQNTAESASTQRVLKRKSDVYADDLLKTGDTGRLQIRFTDGARLSLKPGTEFKIAEYQFDEANPEDGKAVYRLLKGGMRTISGQIGKVDKEDYKLDAVVATIGIRGTDFIVNKQGNRVSGSVNDGAIYVANKDGVSDIAKGFSFQLEGAEGAINRFRTPATVDRPDVPKPPAAPLPAATVVVSEAENEAVALAADENSENTIVSPDPNGSGENAPNESVVALAFSQSGVGASIGGVEISAGSIHGDDSSSDITVDRSWIGGDLVTGVVFNDESSLYSDSCSPCVVSAPPIIGTVVVQDKATIGTAEVSWGRWASGYTVVENGGLTASLGSFHFMYSEDLTPASTITSKTGTLLYRYDSMHGGATSPQDRTGALGTLTDYSSVTGTDGHTYSGTYLLVNFGAQALTEVGIEAEVSGATYVLRDDPSLGGDISLNSVLNGQEVALTGSCSGGGCNPVSTNLSGHMSLDFVGDNAEGAVTSYAAEGINAVNSQPAAISGTILFEAE
ncbi:FecR family protein [Neptuniibacter sp. 1_MG-2023]|uniref:FecR family protein n=1 Tax=Neptuniibacter sp. 1_MG-2023 TaxID=3062662 RepID=UPI0026E2254D|nr:FecR family protein [Neptuniibacter sp. 1_MG-2023]MDO6593522.1 FecR family protein [Neptuniibacter sp. 1_MG-2023]